MSMYAVNNEQSDACFVTNHLLQTLNVPSYPVAVKLSTVLVEELNQCRKASGLIVRGSNESIGILLPDTIFQPRKHRYPDRTPSQEHPPFKDIRDTIITCLHLV